MKRKLITMAAVIGLSAVTAFAGMPQESNTSTMLPRMIIIRVTQQGGQQTVEFQGANCQKQIQSQQDAMECNQLAEQQGQFEQLNQSEQAVDQSAPRALQELFDASQSMAESPQQSRSFFGHHWHAWHSYYPNYGFYGYGYGPYYGYTPSYSYYYPSYGYYYNSLYYPYVYSPYSYSYGPYSYYYYYSPYYGW